MPRLRRRAVAGDALDPRRDAYLDELQATLGGDPAWIPTFAPDRPPFGTSDNHTSTDPTATA